MITFNTSTLKHGQRGFVLLPVVMAIALVAGIAFLMNREGAMNVALADRDVQSDQARYVAEAGFNHQRWQVQNANCTAYTDISDFSFGSHTYSTTVTPTDGSPVSIMATGTLSSGTTDAVTRSDIKVYESTSVDLTLQPDGSSGKDAGVNQQQPTDNHGASNYLTVHGDEVNPKYALIQFDLFSLPPDAKILSAQLDMYLSWSGSYHSDAELSVYRMIEPWVEGSGDSWASGDGVTWATSDGASAWSWPENYESTNAYAVTSQNAASDSWHQWDVSTLVSRWQTGLFPNYGLLLVGNSYIQNANFSSSDLSDEIQHPILTITYTCECGLSCTAGPIANRLLLVVVNPTNLKTQETAKKTLIESWGYTVNLIDVDDSQAAFDAAIADNDVVYITEDIQSNDLGTKLTAATIGVVTEEDNLSDEFGLASTIVWETGSDLTIIENGHYITSPFALGSLSIFSSGESLAYVDGTLAPDLQDLGDSNSGPALVSIYAGGSLYSGGTAAGRRVQLPWGGNDFDVNSLTVDGITIMQRAIEWGAGQGGDGTGVPSGSSLTLISGADTYIYENSGSTNYGIATQVLTGEDNTGPGKKYRGLVQFDISTIPAGATVTSATLRLYQESSVGSDSRGMDVHQITGAWDENTVTWNSSGGGTYDATDLDVTSVPLGTPGWVEWTIPPGLIHEWIDSVSPNYGLLVKYDGEKNRRADFVSREHGTAANHPQLVIEFTEP